MAPRKTFDQGPEAPDACRHRWAVTRLRSGYLVVEGCFQCRHRISFFSEEPVPPIDDYREGEHFWTHLGSFQASKFDLVCEKCGQLVLLNDVMAVMLCLRCDPGCGVYQAAADGPEEKTWVYVALCADTTHLSGTCVSEEGLQALNAYFNEDLHDPGKKIIVVPCRRRRSVDACQGIVLADVGLTELY